MAVDLMPPNTSAKSLCDSEADVGEQLKFNEAPLSNFYELGDELGHGQFASVRKVVERATGELYAAKFVRKRRYATSRRGVPREHIEREISVLRKIAGHENVIELKEVFETPTDIVLVLELVSGGELFDHVCANEYLDETEAAAFIKQILYGLQHLHRNHVVHMDIKPENIMLKKRNESQIKIIDFGLSRIILPGAQVKEMVGTPEFVAPEVVNYEPLSSATDLWALGVVTYILCSGGSPFLGRNREETFCNITSVKYHDINYLSKPAKDFISRLFVRDMRKRATVDECLRHPWISPELTALAEMRRTSSIITGAQLRSFKVRMRWRKAADLVRFCVNIARHERARVKEAQKNGETVDSKYNPSDVLTSAILIAAEEGNLDALEQLVNIHRLDLNVVNALGESPLHFLAGGCGNEKILTYLQRRGLSIEATDSRGDSPLFWAARNGNAQLIRYIMAKNKMVEINRQNKSLETALHVATRYSQTEAALALLESGANVNVQDDQGEAPTHVAAWNNSPLLLSILCRFNPVLSLANKRQQRPIRPLSVKLESRPSTHSGGNLTTKDGRLSAREVKSSADTFTLINHTFSSDSDLSSSLPLSDEEEIQRSARQSPKEFSADIFVPSVSTDSASSNSTSQFSQELHSPNNKRQPKTDQLVHRLFADPKKVASTDFNELVSTLTTSLNKAAELDTQTNETTARRASRTDPITNPFHPLYSPHTASKTKRPCVSSVPSEGARRLGSRPIIPLEGGNENFVDDVAIIRPLVPRLEALNSSNADVKRPTDILVGLSQHNPFRLEAWNDHENEERHIASTARPYNGTKTHENLQHYDPETNGYTGDDEQENGDEPTKAEYEDDFEAECPVRLSSSLPNSTRRPAPCAINYPSTSVFIRLVNSAFEAGLSPQSKFYIDGCCNPNNETALHLASVRGHLECVQSLVESGAPLDTQDETGQTALHLALRRNHTEIALLLITKGCNFDLVDENGDTPLIVASRMGLGGSVQTLCHVGALVDVVNNQLESGLHNAAKEGHLEVCRCLCLSGADVNPINKDEQTAEMLAFQNGHELVGNLLAKMKSETVRDQCIDQLCLLETPLRRIKLKLFGHSGVGKSRLVQSLQSSGMIGSLIDAVSRRFSDNLNTSTTAAEKIKRMSDEGIHSCSSSTSSESTNNPPPEKRPWSGKRPVFENYTTGIDVQNVNFPGCGGEISCWEFGGYEPYHILYDHFVGNTDCIHCIVISCLDPTEVQYKEILYWMNFLKGRVTPAEPISNCGVVSRLSKVVVIGTHATSAQFPTRNADGEFTNSNVDAILKTIRLRFNTHFDIHDHLILLDSTNASCPGMKGLRQYLHGARESILGRLQKPLALLDNCVTFLSSLRKKYANFPVITWPHFTNVIRADLNPLTSDSHCRQLIQQLQLIGEVVYLRDEASELDYVVLSPEWLGTHVLGTLLSAQFLSSCRPDGCYTSEQLTPVFPEITETDLLLRMLDTLQMCAPIDDSRFEFPAFIFTEAPKDIWLRNRPNFVYGGLRILPMRGMERSLQSTFARLQVALRRSMNDFADPMDFDLQQFLECSKMVSGKMEALVRLQGDAVEIQVRGPSDQSSSCVYFLEDIANLIEQTCNEVAPGICLERHFLSPIHLKEHRLQPASFPPEEIMAMQQRESLSIRNTDNQEELFTNVVCFGSREVAAVLTLGVDVSVSQLQLSARCELAALLDPSDRMGRDWSILAVKLNLTDQLPEVDSTGQSLSRTDQLLAEWALQAPETATIGRLCTILEELGRPDARDLLFRTVPLYLFASLDEPHTVANDH